MTLQRSLVMLAAALFLAAPAAGQGAPPAYGYGATSNFRGGEPIDLRRTARPAPDALAALPDDGEEEEAEEATVAVSAPAPANAALDAPLRQRANETGVASWYGAEFAGRPTATGEIFDPNALTAAHPSLPLPSLVEVTNTENGASVVVRVNDRGPFVHGRVLDVSRSAAEALGFATAGQARVEIRYLGPAPRSLVREEAAALGPVGAPLAAAPAPRPPNAAFVVQVGAFSDPANAERVRADLANAGPAFVEAGWVGGRQLHRVRLAAATDAEAEQLRQRVARLGYQDAIVQPR